MLRDKNLILVGIFAIAMAYLESAVVVYLRAMYGIDDLLKDINFKPDIYTFIEVGREAATIIMLAIVAVIAASSKQKRIGYFFFSFGIWDIFYYIWLFIFIQWPKSLLEWDVLFLIPLPWWGPVLAPVLISILLIVIGFLLINDLKFKVTRKDWTAFGFSIILILYTFMEDSISAIFIGEGNLDEIRPTSFNWILFIIPFLLSVMTSINVFLPGRKNMSES
jgi:hypothetical protein